MPAELMLLPSVRGDLLRIDGRVHGRYPALHPVESMLQVTSAAANEARPAVPGRQEESSQLVAWGAHRRPCGIVEQEPRHLQRMGGRDGGRGSDGGDGRGADMGRDRDRMTMRTLAIRKRNERRT